MIRSLGSRVLFLILAATSACAEETPTEPAKPADIPAPVTLPAAIEVTVTTTGAEPDTNGYMLATSRPESYRSQRVAATATYTFADTQPGSVLLRVYDLTPNCTLTGPNPLTVSVRAGQTSRVSFSVNCVASGSLRVTTVTSGTDADANGYYMRELDRSRVGSDVSHSFTSGFDIGLYTNGTSVASALAPGNYVVTISDVAPNCNAVMSAPLTITIVAGVESLVQVPVTCGSPTQIAFVGGLTRDEQDVSGTDIYVVNSNGTGTTRLTSSAGADLNPSWSPDGSRIAFASDRDGDREIYAMNADGSAQVRLTNHPGPDYLPAWSPDGKRMAFVSRRSAASAEIHVMDADGTAAIRLTVNNVNDSDPAWSPDGTRIAFSRSGNIYVVPSSGGSETQLTSNGLNAQPAWSPDGSTIAFRSEGRDTYPAIYLMNPDGSNVRRILGVGYFPSSPDWSRDGRMIAFDDWDCWDYGPCPRGIIIGTKEGLYSIGIDGAAEPAWRPR